MIRIENPPLIDEIDAAFHVRGQPIVFAWGEDIYNPSGGELSPCIVAHEGVHGERQLDYPAPEGSLYNAEQAVTAWWRHYIADPAFRLDEEIPAHVREYEVFCRAANRADRRFYLIHVAHKLSSSLYGNLITFGAAKALIKEQAQ
jgi:hypothetical protein